MDYKPGEVLDRYRIEALVRGGAVSRRYRVRHIELETHHTLVIFTRKSRKLAARQLLTGRLQARLRHKNLVAATDVIRVDEMPALVLDWTNGALLSDHLRSRGGLPIEECDGLAHGLLKGLDYMHRHGVIHRNFKPTGIALEPIDNRYIPKIMDLSLARVFGDEDTQTQNKRRGAIGTPDYMSPEQSRLPNAVDERADIWSFGVTMYEALTDRVPFEGNSSGEVIKKVRAGVYVPLEVHRPDVPDRIAEAIHGALQIDPADRIRNARKMLKLWTGSEERLHDFRIPAAPSGKVTIVFTDVQDSTKLWDADREMMDRVLAAHDTIMRTAIAKRNGYEVKTEGDAFMVSFSRVIDAVHWCADVQIQLAAQPWPEKLVDLVGSLKVRMGIHVGEPSCRPHPITGAMDYFGPMVNRAARIGSAGWGGQILASHAVAMSCRSTKVAIVQVGKYALKGLNEPEELFDIRIPELPRKHPEPRATKVG